MNLKKEYKIGEKTVLFLWLVAYPLLFILLFALFTYISTLFIDSGKGVGGGFTEIYIGFLGTIIVFPFLIHKINKYLKLDKITTKSEKSQKQEKYFILKFIIVFLVMLAIISLISGYNVFRLVSLKSLIITGLVIGIAIYLFNKLQKKK